MDLAGHVYNNIVVVSFISRNKRGMAFYNCKCHCGSLCVISHGNLRSGHTKSCGCLHHKSGPQHHNFKHGKSKKSQVYKAWSKIKERCNNPRDKSYHGYGALGIKMSDLFEKDFSAFYSEIGDPPPGNGWSVDRKDNSAGYIEGNIRWATKSQQARNKG